MLPYPPTALALPVEGPKYFTILGVDPGTTTLGTAALHVDIETLMPAGIEFKTLNANKPSAGRTVNEWMLETHSPRAMRLRELAWMLGHEFNYFRPLFVACEAPFFNRLHPNAFGPLIEVVKMVECTTYAWNCWRPLYRIETTVAKKAVAPETTKLLAEFRELCKTKALPDSKAKVEWCALHHGEFSRLIAGKAYDEHGLDAGVVAYAQLLRIREGDYSITF